MTAIHRIDELLFDLAFESPAMAMARTEELRSLVVDKLLPLMESVFDQFGDDDVVWQIDKLEVDVGNVTEAELPAALLAGLRTALEEALQDDGASADTHAQRLGDDAPARRTRRATSRRGGDVDVLLAFLASGTMPWRVDATAPASHETLMARVLEQSAEQLAQALAASPHRAVMLARLARQFGPAQLQALLRKIAPGRADAVLAHLATLQVLLQDAELAHPVAGGALYAAWEAALAAGLDRDGGSSPSQAQALAARALNWLAEQRRQEVAVVAAQLLREGRIRRDGDAASGEIVHALRRLAEATGSDSSLSLKTTEHSQRAHVGTQLVSTPIAGPENQPAGDLPEEWRALVQQPKDRALLKRLVQQSSPAVMHAVLQQVNPHHAKAMQAQLDGLQGLLEHLNLSSSTLRTALSAAWEYVISASLAQPSQLPATVPMLEQAIAVLLAGQAASGIKATATASAETQGRVHLLARLREAGAALGDPAGLATVLTVMEGMAGRQATASVATSSSSVSPSSGEGTTRDAEPLASGQPHESPAAVVPIRNRVTSALMGGKAGDIYDDWRAFQDSRPDLLRSAIVHYGGYGEIREKMASTFPLSLLLDMQALLVPEAAALTELVWNDERLRARSGADGAVQWSHWRRNWWRGAMAYLLPLVQAQPDTAVAAAGAAASLDVAAYIAAALAGTSATAADEELSAYVMAAVQERELQSRPESAQQSSQNTVQKTKQKATQEIAKKTVEETVEEPVEETAQAAEKKTPKEQQPEAPAEASQPLSLAVLFDAIRSGAQPLQTRSFSVEQLEQWVSEAVREPSFYQAIAGHAVLARDRRTYYTQVLQALAQNRIVDLEEFAAAEDSDVPREVQERISTKVLPASAVLAETTHANAANVESASVPPENTRDNDDTRDTRDTGDAVNTANAGRVDERDRAQLVSRLAKALMKGDPALLYGDWDSLLHKHASLLNEALRHYGIRDDILDRIVRAFPESMLYDMAVLLAPAVAPAWLQLHDQAAWSDVLATALSAKPAAMKTTGLQSEEAPEILQEQAPAPTPDVLAAWKRQLWKAALRQLLGGSQAGNRSIEHDRDVAGGNDAGVDGSPSPAQMPAMDIVSIPALATALAANAELTRSPWQRRVLMRWAELSVESEVTRQDHVQAPLAPITKTARPDSDSNIRAILAQHQRLSATEKLPEPVRAELLERFTTLKGDAASSDAFWSTSSSSSSSSTSWTATELEHLVEACIIAHGATDTPQQQRQTFLLAIKTQAPTASAADRTRYFKAVLRALLKEEMLDLEEIAEASKGDQGSVETDAAGNDQTDGKERPGDLAMQETGVTEAMPAMHGMHGVQESAAIDADRQDEDDQTYIDFLLAPDFRSGASAPAGLREWLRTSIDIAAPPIAPMLAQLSRHADAVMRFLDVLPVSSWPQLAALAPYSALQVQRMRRYAGDVTDMFAEQNRPLSATALTRLEWRFLLPYLFAPDRIFDPARFTGELVGFLARESGSPAPSGLAARLRSQMGIAAVSPQTASRAAASAGGRAGVGGSAEARSNANTSPASSGRTMEHAVRSAAENAGNAQAAYSDDEAALQSPAGIHVANAGMVLMWPFLSRAWEVLALTKDGKFVDMNAAQRAAWLLQFAVDEQTAVPEYQLTLNKLLCGIPLQAPIVPEIDVTEQERELIVQLLTVMISHWSALGQTSVHGLRETFLQREGYLSRKEDAWRLQVPKKTFDMLLEKLPWSISTIRLPWMETILWVEWT